MSITLCVLLWAREGREQALFAYEDLVLQLVPDHGGAVVQRARSSGSNGQPLEIHVLVFPSEQKLSEYMTDDRRVALAENRDQAIARTEVIRVDLV
jgi:uncharacterized protein (DUF1330 family)